MIEIIRIVLEIIGGIMTLYAVGLLLWSIISWGIGAYPLFLRLGFSRWSRKIAIAAKEDKYSSLKIDLVDTGIFREKNIVPIFDGSIAKIKEQSLVLIHYDSFTEEQIKEILSYRNPKAGFIFYFPEFTQTHKISDEMLKIINENQFTTIVNFRGRLMNDIISTFLSTGYEKK